MIVKCQYCNLKDTEKELMIKIERKTSSGNITRKYYHNECYPKFLKEKEFLDKEKEELNYLVETIMNIHDIEMLPKQFYPYLQDLRNGTVLFGRNKKKYKDGYTYSIIAKTYLACADTIKYYKKNKDFKGSTIQELKYCFAIINDKISYIKKLEEKKEFVRTMNKSSQVSSIENSYVGAEVSVENTFKKKKREDDISDFL